MSILDKNTSHSEIIVLAELRGGKGKVTRGYIFRGLAKLLEIKQTQDFLKKNNISQEQVNQMIQRFRVSTVFS